MMYLPVAKQRWSLFWGQPFESGSVSFFLFSTYSGGKMPPKKKKSGKKKLAKMTEEERLLYMEQKRLAEEEMKKKKEDMLTQFLKVNRTNCTLCFLFNLDISSRNSVAVIFPGSHILQWIEVVAKLIMKDWIMLQNFNLANCQSYRSFKYIFWRSFKSLSGVYIIFSRCRSAPERVSLN